MLVNNAKQLLNVSRRLLGNWIVDKALKMTLYGHFCAGEDLERIRPILRSLEKAGVGSILDYVAEADPNEGRMKDVRSNLQVKSEVEQTILARKYSYESETKCDAHVETFLRCIRDVASMGPDGYAAIKVTALGNPALLTRLSTAIVETKRLFETFDENGDGVISREEFENGYK
jgi:proline dehydrogenase